MGFGVADWLVGDGCVLSECRAMDVDGTNVQVACTPPLILESSRRRPNDPFSRNIMRPLGNLERNSGGLLLKLQSTSAIRNDVLERVLFPVFRKKIALFNGSIRGTLRI